jgi:hypothetical protein
MMRNVVLRSRVDGRGVLLQAVAAVIDVEIVHSAANAAAHANVCADVVIAANAHATLIATADSSASAAARLATRNHAVLNNVLTVGSDGLAPEGTVRTEVLFDGLSTLLPSSLISRRIGVDCHLQIGVSNVSGEQHDVDVMIAGGELCFWESYGVGIQLYTGRGFALKKVLVRRYLCLVMLKANNN